MMNQKDGKRYFESINYKNQGLGNFSQNDTFNSRGKQVIDPMVQKHNAAMLAAGRSVRASAGNTTNINKYINDRAKMPLLS